MVELEKPEYNIDVPISRADWQVLGVPNQPHLYTSLRPMSSSCLVKSFQYPLKAFKTATLVYPGMDLRYSW